MPRNDIYDVAQISYGPVGRTVAALLGRAGHTVAVVERRPAVPSRIGMRHLDRDCLRILQSLGIAPRLAASTTQHLEDVLDPVVHVLPTVTIHRSWEAVALVQHPDHIEVRCRSIYLGDAGEPILGDEVRTVRARYVIGADGANSFVRDRIGSRRLDFGPHGSWIVADRWRALRVFVAGDAAHVMPPTISESICSGLRDRRHSRGD
jgi:2-polyprenyl-6-methoxyphenol hydroxylase-like FAD-dependent oxidoreductase